MFLDQGWSDEDRLRYYNTSQGSAALSYDIFLNLEKATDQSLFRADENMTGYGFVPQPADPKYNPDGVPIGITRTVVTDGPWKGEWAGLGCAACHNGQLEYKGTEDQDCGWQLQYVGYSRLHRGLGRCPRGNGRRPGEV